LLLWIDLSGRLQRAESQPGWWGIEFKMPGIKGTDGIKGTSYIAPVKRENEKNHLL
jgi:hypothetical protein